MGVLKSTATQPGTAVSVGGASTQISSGVRSSAGTRYISNDHATQVVYLTLGPGPAVLNSGIRLGPASPLPLVIESYTGPIFAIASGAATPVLVTEV